MPGELAHLFFDPPRRFSTLGCIATASFLDQDELFSRLPVTSEMYDSVPDDDMGLHGYAQELAGYAIHCPGLESTSNVLYHKRLDMVVHRIIEESSEGLDEIFRPAGIVGGYAQHIAFEACIDRAVNNKAPKLRESLIRAYLLAVPRAQAMGSMLSGFLNERGQEVSSDLMARRIRFSIGWGLGRMLSMHYISALPDPSEDLSADLAIQPFSYRPADTI
mgnify:FL=1